LRLESSGFSINNGFVDRLNLSLVERNLLDGNVLLGASFDLLPATISVGNVFAERRLFDSRWALSQSFNLIFNRATGRVEGSSGAVDLSLPLWDLRPRWGFEARFAWNDSVGRQMQGPTLLTWDPPADLGGDPLPRIWDRAIYQGTVAGLRQFGTETVQRLRFGYAIAISDYTPHRDTGLHALPRQSPLRQAFEDEVLADSRRELFPFLGWEAFDPTWVVFEELGAFGIAEEIRVGPWASASLSAPLKTFGSRRDAIAWGFGAGLVLAPVFWNDHALIDLMASLRGRLEAGEVIDQVYRLRLRAATPRFFGRLAMAADLELRSRDSFRTLVSLGGDNGLRGYPSQAFFTFGGDRFRFNLEWRSPPFVLGSVHFGGVLFYDAGGLGDISEAMPINHAVGLGLRLLFPQFNRFVFRFDLGAPIRGESFTVLLSIGNSQLLSLSPAEDTMLGE